MRLLEIIVVAAALFSSILWIIRKGTPRLKFLLTLATGIVGVVQWLVEGYRTAMLPIYVLIGGLLIVEQKAIYIRLTKLSMRGYTP
jgi:hypothetical protein